MHTLSMVSVFLHLQLGEIRTPGRIGTGKVKITPRVYIKRPQGRGVAILQHHHVLNRKASIASLGANLQRASLHTHILQAPRAPDRGSHRRTHRQIQLIQSFLPGLNGKVVLVTLRVVHNELSLCISGSTSTQAQAGVIQHQRTPVHIQRTFDIGLHILQGSRIASSNAKHIHPAGKISISVHHHRAPHQAELPQAATTQAGVILQLQNHTFAPLHQHLVLLIQHLAGKRIHRHCPGINSNPLGVYYAAGILMARFQKIYA